MQLWLLTTVSEWPLAIIDVITSFSMTDMTMTGAVGTVAGVDSRVVFDRDDALRAGKLLGAAAALIVAGRVLLRLGAGATSSD